MKMSRFFMAAPDTVRFIRETFDIDDESAPVRRYHDASGAHMGRHTPLLPSFATKNLHRGPDTKETRPEVGM
jgi:hypothetical protein